MMSADGHIYNLLEIANVHEGDFDYFINLIKEFHDVEDAHGVKVQVLKADEIALPEYAWFSVYEKLYFSERQWEQIIDEIGKTKHIWIDVFDDYSIKIFKENLDKIEGIKLQASILANKNIIRQLGSIGMSEKRMIINIAGMGEDEIDLIFGEITRFVAPKEVILQIGFQSYPTKLEDSGLAKIPAIKERFHNRISFADHIDGGNEDSLWLPVFAALSGATLIEKHIKATGTNPEYDNYSAIDKERYVRYLNNLNRYLNTKTQPFINDNEAKYLANSLQIPVIKTAKKKGQIISSDDDLDFRRTNLSGLKTDELNKLIADFNILSGDKEKHDVIRREDLKKATIATIIAGRMKSTRLPKKATAKIGDISSVELCIKNCLKFENVNHTILATSVLPEDEVLGEYTYSPNVVFHRGDPEDVIQRYIDVIDALKIDVIIRVTADMPYVSNEILQILLTSHFQNGADYTTANSAAIGTNLEIINAQALRFIKSFFPSANYSEYMTWYFKNNPEHLRLNFIDLPPSLVRDYRLTLDYEQDLEMFNKIEKHFSDGKIDFSLLRLFEFLDGNPEIASMNKNLEVKYQTDQSLIDTLNRVTKIK